MRSPAPLIPARLTRRYKRFLADATPESGPDAGREITAHIANPGAMTGLAEPGQRIWLSHAPSPKRKLAYSWELTETADGALVGVSTMAPNRIVAEALTAGALPEFRDYPRFRREVKYGTNSRIDFLLESNSAPPLYLEVKNVHLMRTPGLAEFPDSVTARGRKHLVELAAIRETGARAVMLYLVQRYDCGQLSFALDIDAAYAKAYAEAAEQGVEAVAYACRLTLGADNACEITVDRRIPIE